MGGIAALITPPLAAHDCEIPAYAGMVCLGIIVCWWIFGIVAHDTVRFLPTQEWSRGGRECIAKNTPDCCPPPMAL